jgi:hypothetical protein
VAGYVNQHFFDKFTVISSLTICGWKQPVINSWKKFVAKCVEDGFTMVGYILQQAVL